MPTLFRRWIAPALMALGCVTASASGLQVSPITLTLQPKQNADGLWLGNTGEGTVQAQVRVYRWTQEDGQDKLTPTRELIVSPPMLQVPAGGRQLIRVIRGQPSTHAAELAYRIIIDELPVQEQSQQPASGPSQALQFVFSYSLPIFLAPVQPSSDAGLAPRLSWQMVRDGDGLVLHVSNSGAMHAQLSGLKLLDATGKRTEIHQGMLGYVLPGAQMRWPLKSIPPLGPEPTIEAQVNDRTEQYRVQTGAHAR